MILISSCINVDMVLAFASMVVTVMFQRGIDVDMPVAFLSEKNKFIGFSVLILLYCIALY